MVIAVLGTLEIVGISVAGLLVVLGIVYRIGKGANVSRKRAGDVLRADERRDATVDELTRKHEASIAPKEKERREALGRPVEDTLNDLIRDGRL